MSDLDELEVKVALAKAVRTKKFEEALEKDKKYQWNLCSNPNRIRIQTIDS